MYFIKIHGKMTLGGVKNGGDKELNPHGRRIEQLILQCKELETSYRLEVVRSQRLDEHVDVLSRKIMFLEGEIEKTKGMLRKESWLGGEAATRVWRILPS